MVFISVATENLTGMCLGKGMSEQREGGTTQSVNQSIQTWISIGVHKGPKLPLDSQF